MKIVLTFGVFDLLHLGHILLFKHAKEFGDKLVVAVQDSDYVLKYKPDARIVYSTNDRIFMVSAIKYVDEVVVYKDVDNAIQTIKFDVFAIGEDQSHSGFQRATSWCLDHNKEVRFLTRTEGISSSLLREYLSIK